MTERVSDGLLAELERKINDGTPRGFVWPVIAPLALSIAPVATTDEEVAAVNDALVALIVNADERALEMLEIQALLAKLKYRNDPT